MPKRGGNISLTSYDDIFETDESRAESQLERVQNISISELVPFKDHPFKVVDDEAMLRTTESIAQYGVLTPLIARPLEGGGYEIISGHRRAHAAEMAGLTEVPVLVRQMDDDAATVLMVDSNLQRENILPSERAYAYKMKLEAMKHQGSRSDLTSSQVGTKLRTDQVMAAELGESRNQIQRYIRLTNLIPELLEMVDQKQISFNPAVELSYLAPEEQEIFMQAMDEVQASPSLSQAQRLKKLAQEGDFTMDAAREIMNEVKKGDLERVTFRNEQLRKYFPRSYTTQQMQDTTPILLMLLNDSEGRLANALINYDLLDQMDESIRQMFARAYSDDFSQAEDILRNEFGVLRKQRLCVSFDEVRPLKKRLQVSLTDVFEAIYPKAISFNFDGLLTASNNFTGKGSQYFCQIVKMLLSNNVNYDTIHDFTSDVRSKITAVLMETSATSWKCISSNYAMMPPAEPRARSIYEDAVAQLNTDKQYDCGNFFEKYCYPPYGLSEEAAIMMLSVILANHSYCVRVFFNDSQNSIIRWKDEVIIKDKKINIDLIKSSRLILIDTNAVEARFQQLFNRLDATTELDAIIRLQREIQQ